MGDQLGIRERVGGKRKYRRTWFSTPQLVAYIKWQFSQGLPVTINHSAGERGLLMRPQDIRRVQKHLDIVVVRRGPGNTTIWPTEQWYQTQADLREWRNPTRTAATGAETEGRDARDEGLRGRG